MNNEKIKLSNNSSFVILIFLILKFRNIGRFTFRRSEFWSPPCKKPVSVQMALNSFWGGGQNLERRNVKRPIIRNFKVANIK